MAGKIFYRKRTKQEQGEKVPRYKVVAVADSDLMVLAEHLRKKELKKIAKLTGCTLVELQTKGGKGCCREKD